MISRTGYGLSAFLLLTLAAGLDSRPAHAQARPFKDMSLEDVPIQAPSKISPWGAAADQPPQEPSEKATADDDDKAPADDKATADKPADEKTADDRATEDEDVASLDIDWSLLDVDASTLMSEQPVKLHAASHESSSGGPAWSSQDKANGSAVSVKQSVSPFMDTRIGADMTVVRQPTTLSELLTEKATGIYQSQSSGTAWASVSAPGVGSIWDKTTVEAKVDPSQDQGSLGTSLSKSLKLGEQYSLTLQNGYNMTQGFAPTPGGTARTTYATDQSAQFGVTETGTSFSAGQTLSTSDERWLRRIGAEQKIVGGFNISGSIAETPLGIANKSLTAGFKQSW
jgi:hypothetical protein